MERVMSPISSEKKTAGRLAKTKNMLYEYRYLHLMMLPALVFFVLFRYLPMYGIMIAFTRYDPIGGFWGIITAEWVGLDHFRRLFDSIFFTRILRNTLLISMYRLVFAFPMPIILAILINEVVSVRFKRAVQTITYMPFFLSWVVVSGMIIVLLSPTSGPVAAISQELGLQPTAILSDRRFFRSILVISDIWRSIGFGSIIYLAAITGIDQEIYEAATVDGATRIQKIFRITLPQLGFVISIMLILSLGRILNENFEQIINLYSPAVYEVADVFETYVFRTGVLGRQHSMAAAVGLFQSTVSLVMILFCNRAARMLGYEGLW